MGALGPFGLWEGIFYMKPATATSIRGTLMPVGLLSQRQFLVWSALVVPIGFAESFGGGGSKWVPYNIPGVPFAFNCTKWAKEAVLAARIASLLPTG